MVNFRQTINRLTKHTEFHHTRALIDRLIAEVESQIRRQKRKD
jgi:hypothetical protein